jgi:hypothetical protein
MQARKTHYNTKKNPRPNATNKNQKPKLQSTKSKKPMQKNGQRMGKNKEQDIKTHNKGWTKDRRQQTNEIKGPQKRKTLVTNYIINIIHQDST